MVIFCYPELSQWTDFSDNLIDVILLHIFHYMLDITTLFLVIVEYTTAVLRAYVVALSIELCRIVNGKENLQ